MDSAGVPARSHPPARTALHRLPRTAPGFSEKEGKADPVPPTFAVFSPQLEKPHRVLSARFKVFGTAGCSVAWQRVGTSSENAGVAAWLPPGKGSRAVMPSPPPGDPDSDSHCWGGQERLQAPVPQVPRKAGLLSRHCPLAVWAPAPHLPVEAACWRSALCHSSHTEGQAWFLMAACQRAACR